MLDRWTVFNEESKRRELFFVVVGIISQSVTKTMDLDIELGSCSCTASHLCRLGADPHLSWSYPVLIKP